MPTVIHRLVPKLSVSPLELPPRLARFKLVVPVDDRTMDAKETIATNLYIASEQEREALP